MEKVYRGVAAAPGVVDGVLFDYRLTPPEEGEHRLYTESEQTLEIQRFEDALQRLITKIESTRRFLSDSLGAFLDLELQILSDPSFRERVHHLIRGGQLGARRAVLTIMEEYAKPMEKGDGYFKDRAREIRTLAQQLIREMAILELPSLDPSNGDILVARDLSIREAVEVARKGFRGVVLEEGGKTSHPVIILRDFRIPTLIQVEDLPPIPPGTSAILDTRRGLLVVDPSRHTREQYTDVIRAFEQRSQELQNLKGMEAETLDGHTYKLLANVELIEEIPLLEQLGIPGIGLLRTELLFWEAREDLEGQEAFYRDIATRLAPHPVTVRLFDLGGDKILQTPLVETNPFLGVRGIRALLRAPRLLKTQLRALVRANDAGNLRIMIPMVTSVEEVEQVKTLLEEVAREEGREVPPLGAMIETPAAALMTEVLARHVSFFSIGTNDLTQYVLAMDRLNPYLQNEFTALHPAVIRLLWFTVKRARRAGVWLAVCGEMASDLIALPLLVGLGVEELSMSPSMYLEAKDLIRSIHREETQKLVEQAMNATTSREIEDMARAFLRERVAPNVRLSLGI